MTTIEQWASRHKISPEALNDLRALCGVPAPVSHASSEADTQALIRIAAARAGYAMWRNNNGACLDDTGRMIRYGLGNDSAKLNAVWKSSDLIGIGPGGRFVACEVKHPRWRAPESDRDRAQLAMLTQVNALGGIGFFATDPQHYLEHVK